MKLLARKIRSLGKQIRQGENFRRISIASLFKPLRLKSLRLHLILTGLVTVGAYLLAVGGIVFVPRIASFESGTNPIEELERAAGQLLFLHAHFWPVALGAIITVFASSLFLYHKTTEPLVRFRRAFDNVRQGIIPAPIRLRGTDFLSKDAAALSAMLESLQLHLSEISRQHDALSETISELQAASAEGTHEELIERLGNRDKELDDQLRFFRLEA
jgi:methyl-accepting chemotaxis protein